MASAITRFPVVTIGALAMTDTSLTVKAGVPLILGGNGTDPNHAINRAQLDSVKESVDALQSVVTTLSGSDLSYDTLGELKTFIDEQTANGVTTLTAAVTNEAQLREVAIAAETAAREVAINTEKAAREAAVSASIAADAAEAQLRATGDDDEAAAREVAIAAEAQLRATGDADETAAREAGDLALSKTVFNVRNVILNAAVVPDESQPMAMPESVKNSVVYDGWWFKNKGPGVPAARKINWYLNGPSDNNGIVKYSSMKELGLMLSLPGTGKLSTPFLTIYTKLKSSGNAGTWYNAKHTYLAYGRPELINSPTTQIQFLFRLSLNDNTPVSKIPGFTNVDLVKDESTSYGTMLGDDEILAIAIGTDSSAAAGRVECVVHRLQFITGNGNVSYAFSNSGPLDKLQTAKLDQILASMGQSTLSDAIATNL